MENPDHPDVTKRAKEVQHFDELASYDDDKDDDRSKGSEDEATVKFEGITLKQTLVSVEADPTAKQEESGSKKSELEKNSSITTYTAKQADAETETNQTMLTGVEILTPVMQKDVRADEGKWCLWLNIGG